MVNSALKRLTREPILKLKETENEDLRETYIKALTDLYNIKRDM